MSFHVQLMRPDALTEPAIIHPLTALQAISYSATDRGGFNEATVTVRGPVQAVQEALRWLRWGVEIRNEYNTVCWAGYVHEVDLLYGGIRYRASLDDLANKIAALYSYEDADGVQVSAQTDFVSHEASQARYGVRELVIAASDTEQAAAEQLRDTELARRQTPQAEGDVEPGGGPVEATLKCRGWWHTLGWRYYSNELGREEHAEGDATQPLGLGFTSTDVGFVAGGALNDLGGRLRYFPENQKVIVSGSTSNNGTFTISEAPSAEAAQSYAADTISFETDDDIKDSAAGLAFLKKGSIINVTGTTSNNGRHVIDSEGAGHVTTYTGFGGTISAESAGTTYTIYQGNYVRVAEAMSNEDTGDTVTVACYGQKIAQSFQLSSASGWDAARIAVQVAATGTPTDDLTVSLCSDSSGAPGTVLGSGTIDADDVGSALIWRWADLSSNVSLSTSTTYWITIERGGSADWDDFYTVGVDEDSGYSLGALKVYDGSAWQDRPTAADLKFRVWGEEPTTAQIETMAGGAEFIRGVSIENASGVSANQYRAGEGTLLAEVEALLDIGDSSGDRLIAVITAERALRVYADPGEASPFGKWTADGRLTSRVGGQLEPGRLIVGGWMEIEEVPPAVDALAPFSPRYCSGSEFDVSEMRLRPIFGEDSPFNLSVRAG